MKETHPQNVIKFCPKCGSSGFPLHGSRSFKCAGCGFHLYFNSSAAVAALVTDGNGKLMLVTRGVEPDYGKLDLPGGFVDPAETVENAVKRELFEELGLQVKSMKYVGSAPNEYIFGGLSVFTIDMAFEVIPESVVHLNPMDDILEYRFYSKEEVDFNDIPAPSIRKFVVDFFNSKEKEK